MRLLNLAPPILRLKQSALDYQDQVGLLRIHWQIGNRTIFSRFYTRIDQVFIVWGLIIAIIFGVAQFCPINWTVQAIIWTGLTGIGTAGMIGLAWFWVTVERLRWVVHGWAILMSFGIVYTDLGILGGWWQLLPYLCPLWLGVSALGYLITGLGMRSRAFLVVGAWHLIGIVLLPHTGGWQYLSTGAVMTGSLLVLSEMQWDMRPPIDFNALTVEQKHFNQEQHRLRRLAVEVQ
ncbi:MAG: hypothetical protein HC827_04445 [Cyanobacteria bacterium RM1_2_2]|nr:hypothetical protein [Cyanobacteria bacterium RM1_2_2]